MNIEIANRLVELRKKNGYSQEELADKLGLSRQAVSKWERAESSPDTDNLICLAKLYNISLDELLNTDQSVEEIRKEVKEKESDSVKKIEISEDGVTITENGETKIIKKGRYSHLSEQEQKRAKAFDLFECISTGALFLIATVVYLWVSFEHGSQWGKLWIIFLAPPVISSVMNAIKNRRFCQFAYPVAATLLYLGLGLYLGMWHPTWIIFITIPVFYTVFGPIDKYIANKRGEDIDPEDNDED